MKICHCIKLTPQEKTAIEIVQGILHEMVEDTMIHDDFEREKDGCLDDISAWFDDVTDYLEGFGE
jgi:hypothetical protein